MNIPIEWSREHAWSKVNVLTAGPIAAFYISASLGIREGLRFKLKIGSDIRYLYWDGQEFWFVSQGVYDILSPKEKMNMILYTSDENEWFDMNGRHLRKKQKENLIVLPLFMNFLSQS